MTRCSAAGSLIHYCESLHRFFAQVSNVLQEAGGSQDVSGTCTDGPKKKNNFQTHEPILILLLCLLWCKRSKTRQDRLVLYVLTNDDLTGLGGFGDLVRTARLRVADAAQDEDDEAGAVPVVVRRVRLMFLPCAEEEDGYEGELEHFSLLINRDELISFRCHVNVL